VAIIEQFLYQKIESLEEAGHLQEMPDFIEQCLSERIVLRDYQRRAFQYFVTYYENEGLRKNKQLHTLFHMATGAGKTVIMAGLLPYFYTKGYRKFLFFVNQTNILEKTKENFLNPASGKYLFAENMEIWGERVPIREIDNFSVIDEHAINICFTTTQKLHLDLNFSRENSVTIEDFEDDKIVLISDESHHVNTRTKRRTKAEEEADNSWEYSVERIFRANRDSVLLEFTATCDLKDPAVLRKYTDKIVFDYSLPRFRDSGYTKDFQNLQSNFGPWERTLGALILSEYRRNLFADYGQDIKPVVLLKSRRIVESESFYKEFFENLDRLSPEEIASMDSPDNALLSKAIGYFRGKEGSLEALTYALKLGFAKDNSIIMNGSRDNTVEKQLAVNSLEEPSNPHRIIFTVDMLNEGWDVLNLFDIVRLYETRQSKNYTIQEAQLIGRGARYCPFVAEDDQERFKRKYDYDPDSDNRILETLLYHSKQDSRYIAELRKALTETGLLPENPVEIEYCLKDSFKETLLFQHGSVFANKRTEKSRENVTQIEKKIQTGIYHVQVPGLKSRLYSLFDEEGPNNGGSRHTKQIKIKDLPLNILYGATDRFDSLKFNVLKSHYPQLKSKREFLTSPRYVGNVTLVIESDSGHLTAKQLYYAVKEVLGKIAKHVSSITEEYKGTKEFYAKPIRNVIRNKKRCVANPSGDGEGISQAVVVRELAVNLYGEDWYVYEDNYGTTEEKAFVKYFHGLIPELRKKYEEIYLIRNERFPELAIYDFDTGERFEPDFLLFLRKKNQDGYRQEQIYVEPKGSHLVSSEQWKEDFLLRIGDESIPVKVYVDDNEYRIYGLPFFNRENRWKSFDEVLRARLL
jgi:type III restriction enzyme